MHVEEEDDDESQPTGLCCMGGCLTGCAFAILLLVILPAGVLLTFYAANNQDYGVLSAGICLIVIPLMSVPVAFIIFFNRRRIRQFRKRKTIRDAENKELRNNQTRF